MSIAFCKVKQLQLNNFLKIFFKDYSKWERSARPKPLLWATLHHKAVISSNKRGIRPSPTGKSGINMDKDEITGFMHCFVISLYEQGNLKTLSKMISQHSPNSLQEGQLKKWSRTRSPQRGKTISKH